MPKGILYSELQQGFILLMMHVYSLPCCLQNFANPEGWSPTEKKKKKETDFFKHSFKPTQWILNACGMLDKSSNFLKQSHSLYLVYECLTYLNKESRNRIFLYIFSAHQQNDLQI